MYLYHYGLRELPFTLTPNTEFYCDLAGHHAALEVLTTALKTGEGFIKVVGEVGTGKTLLCRKLLNEIPDFFVTVYIPNPYLDPQELREAIAAELQIDTQADYSSQQLTKLIQQRLLEINRAGQSVVIILDEAQALPSESLEALRLFSNLETERRKLVHLVLFGQPELDEKLAEKVHRQLRQRITFSYQLGAMSEAEVATYISHRLHVAGYRGPAIMPAAVVRAIYQASRGIPRLVNVLCHKVLLLCFGEGVHQVKVAHVRNAAVDTEDASELSRWRWKWAFGGLLLLAILLGAGYVLDADWRAAIAWLPQWLLQSIALDEALT